MLIGFEGCITCHVPQVWQRCALVRSDLTVTFSSSCVMSPLDDDVASQPHHCGRGSLASTSSLALSSLGSWLVSQCDSAAHICVHTRGWVSTRLHGALIFWSSSCPSTVDVVIDLSVFLKYHRLTLGLNVGFPKYLHLLWYCLPMHKQQLLSLPLIESGFK